MHGREIILRRESYFKDAVFILTVTAAMSVTNRYYSGIGTASVVVWVILALYTLKAYASTVTISDDGVAAKHLLGGWSFLWSEVRVWYAVEDTDRNRIIRFRAGGNNKIYNLPTDVIDESRYRQTEEFFRKHCGAPRKSDSWLYRNPSDN